MCRPLVVLLHEHAEEGRRRRLCIIQSHYWFPQGGKNGRPRRFSTNFWFRSTTRDILHCEILCRDSSVTLEILSMTKTLLSAGVKEGEGNQPRSEDAAGATAATTVVMPSMLQDLAWRRSSSSSLSSSSNVQTRIVDLRKTSHNYSVIRTAVAGGFLQLRLEFLVV